MIVHSVSEDIRGLTMWLIVMLLVAPLLAIGKREICADLCFSGLGGAPCGIMCNQNLNLSTLSANITKDVMGPRRTVCDVLCKNNLGHPLCGCPSVIAHDVDWDGVCDAFCRLESYALYGCPWCAVPRRKPQRPRMGMHIRSTHSLNWDELCVFLCNKGDGGSACNCDVIP